MSDAFDAEAEPFTSGLPATTARRHFATESPDADAVA
jgi:hypothetical protein